MLDFTGERVIPGLVDPNLFNEHLARYRFAKTFAQGATVLDAGCGSGYGTAELVEAAFVAAIDVSEDAIRHARSAFRRQGVVFVEAACESLPFADASFDLVVAFEVIEHLERWREMLAEASRVLKPSGVLLVSTPNKAYYAESRAAAGPNPFHVREFEYEEFRAALAEFFPQVQLWSQNHSESIAFVPGRPSRGTLDASADTAPANAHFFLAACSRSPLGPAEPFAYLPQTGNALREREHHIALLETELAQKDDWLKQIELEHESLQKSHEGLLGELNQQNVWAEQLNAEIEQARGKIAGLQDELKATHRAYQDRLRELEGELKTTHSGYQDRLAAIELEIKTLHEGYQESIAASVGNLEEQIERGRREIARLNAENESYYSSMTEGEKRIAELEAELRRVETESEASLRALRAELQRLEPMEQENARLRSVLDEVGGSKWIRLGRSLGVGPTVNGD